MKVRRGWAEGGPRLLVKELTGDGKGLAGEIALGGISVPDILATQDPSGQPLTTLYDAKNNLYHYIFQENVYNTEYALTTTKYALTFADGMLYVTRLASYEKIMSGYDGSTRERYYLPQQGNDAVVEIDAARYDRIELEEFPGCTPKSIPFRWMSPDDLKNAAAEGRLRETLAASYVSFAE